jgi:hypothetical protein
VRRDVAAELEDDLGVVRQPNAPRVAAPTSASDEREHPLTASEACDPARPESLTPDLEEVAESRGSADVDHAGGVEGS